ncbi:hypothetical protein GLYMA_13G126100v4 [Glycine max]|uniref:Uncharacterized protein n=1 Tax=Glycine max TaxID=3847 RepID=K7LZC5_SOYBN|nr:hypothetical protein JHK85_036824 [Glycine max]KAG5130099.1 hypothetical protein JHK84_036496 [Glycine max]KAH1101191.1 hypothetical protein GYH30_036005 [Glycine max]KRH19606.1 hypothetical protein GLYMA_13G126100v4 [Glycine max]
MELTNEGQMVRVDVGGSSSTKLISKDQEFPAEINFNYKKCFFFKLLIAQLSVPT